MSAFYTGLQKTAANLLAEYGEPCTVRVQTGTGFDPATQTAAPTYEDYAANVYVGNYSGRTNEDGTLVQTNDRKLIVSALGITLEPQLSARIVVGAMTYTAQNIKPIGGKGIQAIYIVQGRS